MTQKIDPLIGQVVTSVFMESSTVNINLTRSQVQLGSLFHIHISPKQLQSILRREQRVWDCYGAVSA